MNAELETTIQRWMEHCYNAYRTSSITLESTKNVTDVVCFKCCKLVHNYHQKV